MYYIVFFINFRMDWEPFTDEYVLFYMYGM
jgi:hypothetical protein